MDKKKQSTISFTAYDAAHLYDLALAHFCISREEGECVVCIRLKERLESFIGQDEAQQIQEQARKHPYCAASPKR